ncbi:MAG: Hsp70 family protein [Polyangiaceae bacterium]
MKSSPVNHEAPPPPMGPPPTVFAIDFGTSNSLLAAASPEHVYPPAPLDPSARDPTILRSALYFLSLEQRAFGRDATTRWLEDGMRGRLIRSIKRHLPSRSFTATRIGSRQATLEDLIGIFLRTMRERACAHYGVDVRRGVFGRPARFSNVPEDDALAEERLRKAAALAGFDEVHVCPEPVAAAYDFREELSAERLVLVADLGGGTSDFTVVRMRESGFRPSDVLGVGGVPVAGDALDGALVRAKVAPLFGAHARYRVPFGANELTMPKALIEILASPADLTVTDRGAVLRQLESIRSGLVSPSERPMLERFIALVEDGLGFTLYEGVEAAKRALSDVDKTDVVVEEPSIATREPVSRAELEDAAARPVEAIVAALDKTLEVAAVRGEDIDIACLTGGTARVPLVIRALRERLPRAAVRELSSFHAVVNGLARRAREVA